MDFHMVQGDVFRLHGEGRYDEALTLVDDAFEELPKHAATLSYWRACLLARSGDDQQALHVLQEALRQGHWYDDELLRADEDLAALRGVPAFDDVLAAGARHREAAESAPPPDPLVVLPSRPGPAPLLVALHGAGDTPDLSVSHWRSAARAGWLVALPHGPHMRGSDSRVWLDRELEHLDLASAERAVGEPVARLAEHHEIAEGRTVLAGFAQGAAVALWLGLSGRVPARGILALGASFRYREVLDALPDEPAALRVQAIAGADERHVDAAREMVEALTSRGVDCSLDVREGLGHTFPSAFVQELPEHLESLAP